MTFHWIKIWRFTQKDILWRNFCRTVWLILFFYFIAVGEWLILSTFTINSCPKGVPSFGDACYRIHEGYSETKGESWPRLCAQGADKSSGIWLTGSVINCWIDVTTKKYAPCIVRVKKIIFFNLRQPFLWKLDLIGNYIYIISDWIFKTVFVCQFPFSSISSFSLMLFICLFIY